MPKPLIPREKHQVYEFPNYALNRPGKLYCTCGITLQMGLGTDDIKCECGAIYTFFGNLPDEFEKEENPRPLHHVINWPDYGDKRVGLMMCDCGQKLVMELDGRDIHCKCGKYYNCAGKSPAECFFGEEKRAEIKKNISVVIGIIVVFVVLAVAAWVFLAMVSKAVGI